MVNHKPQYIDDAPVGLARGRISERSADRVRERVSERNEEKRLKRPNMGRLSDDGRFAVDLDRKPRDVTYNWKRMQLFGQNDKRNQVLISQFHWAPVPHKDQPHILGHLETDENAPIIIDGLMLCQRPTYLCDDAEREQLQETDYVTNAQLQALKLTSKDQVGDRYTKIRKSVAQFQAVD